MKKSIRNLFSKRVAAAIVPVLTAVLFVCANSNSCLMIHQPKAPEGLERFSKVK